MIRCKGTWFLFATLLVLIVVIWWLADDSEDAIVHEIFVEHDRLVLRGERKAALELLVSEIQKREGEGPLSPVWLPLIRANKSGFIQLEYLIRVVDGSPQREDTYREIAKLIEVMPDRYREEIRLKVVKMLGSVSDVESQYLKKYGLELVAH